MITEIDITTYRPIDIVNIAGIPYRSDNNKQYYLHDNDRDIILEDSAELDIYKYYKIIEKLCRKPYYVVREDIYIGSHKGIFGIFDNSITNDSIIKLNSDE